MVGTNALGRSLNNRYLEQLGYFPVRCCRWFLAYFQWSCLLLLQSSARVFFRILGVGVSGWRITLWYSLCIAGVLLLSISLSEISGGGNANAHVMLPRAVSVLCAGEFVLPVSELALFPRAAPLCRGADGSWFRAVLVTVCPQPSGRHSSSHVHRGTLDAWISHSQSKRSLLAQGSPTGTAPSFQGGGSDVVAALCYCARLVPLRAFGCH